jgi:hypothetical protein
MELVGPMLRRAIAEVKQHWSVMRWVTKNLLSRAVRASEGTLSRWSRLNLVDSTHQLGIGPTWWVMARSPYV